MPGHGSGTFPTAKATHCDVFVRAEECWSTRHLWTTKHCGYVHMGGRSVPPLNDRLTTPMTTTQSAAEVTSVLTFPCRSHLPLYQGGGGLAWGSNRPSP